MVFGKVWVRENWDELKSPVLFFPQILRTPDYFADIAPPSLYICTATHSQSATYIYQNVSDQIMTAIPTTPNDQSDRKSVIYAEKLTVKEAAAALEHSETTVRRWFREGYLKAVKYGRKWYILKSDLEEFMEGKQSEGGTNDDQNRE